jgi:GMP synthase (glutamine-hydrolysing)
VKKPVLILQHTEAEGPGRVAPAMLSAGLSLQVVHHYREALPCVPEQVPAQFAGVVLLGGPMAVYERDRYPFLDVEIELVRHAMRAQLPLLGICLGSQILAQALGGNVRASGALELGYHEVALAPRAAGLFADVPQKFNALHWHGDVFSLPPGAVPLASSGQTPLQAFSAGATATGVLFHLEADAAQLAAMATAFPEDLLRAGYTYVELATAALAADAALTTNAHTVFGNFAKLCLAQFQR